jgi:hypothetical protein
MTSSTGRSHGTLPSQHQRNAAGFEPADLDWQLGTARDAAQVAGAMGLELDELRALIAKAREFLREHPERSNLALAVTRAQLHGMTRRELELAELADFHELSRRHVGIVRLSQPRFDEAREWWRAALLGFLSGLQPPAAAAQVAVPLAAQATSDVALGAQDGDWFTNFSGSWLAAGPEEFSMGELQIRAQPAPGLGLSGPGAAGLSRLVVRWPFEGGQIVLELNAPTVGTKTWHVIARLESEQVSRAAIEINHIGKTLKQGVATSVSVPAPKHGQWPCVLRWRTEEGGWHERSASLKVSDLRGERPS